MPPEVYESPPDISLKKITADQGDESEDTKGIGDPYQITTDDDLKAPVLLTLDYEPADLPDGSSEKNIYIATRKNGKWIPVEGGFVKPDSLILISHKKDLYKGKSEAIINPSF